MNAVLTNFGRHANASFYLSRLLDYLVGSGLLAPGCKGKEAFAWCKDGLERSSTQMLSME